MASATVTIESNSKRRHCHLIVNKKLMYVLSLRSIVCHRRCILRGLLFFNFRVIRLFHWMFLTGQRKKTVTILQNTFAIMTQCSTRHVEFEFSLLHARNVEQWHCVWRGWAMQPASAGTVINLWSYRSISRRVSLKFSQFNKHVNVKFDSIWAVIFGILVTVLCQFNFLCLRAICACFTYSLLLRSHCMRCAANSIVLRPCVHTNTWYLLYSLRLLSRSMNL